MLFSSETSICRKSTPSSVAVVCPFWGSLAERMTLRPCCLSCLAVSWPMPLLAPVMRAVFCCGFIFSKCYVVKWFKVTACLV